jgi:hypothetical protein
VYVGNGSVHNSKFKDGKGKSAQQKIQKEKSQKPAEPEFGIEYLKALTFILPRSLLSSRE